jgi:CubicO group peptidase (beta-lactamase class C family)
MRALEDGGIIKLGWVAAASSVLLAAKVSAAELPRAAPGDVGFSSQRLDYMDSFYENAVKKGDMAGVVILVARHGKIAHLSAIGYADIEKKRKMQADTIFRLYSMTKPIASTALMMLYEEGRFQLQDPISQYLPEFANLRVLRNPDGDLTDTVPLDRPPTMQDILRHTGGFGTGASADAFDTQYRNTRMFDPDVSLAQSMTILAKLPLRYQPGTRWVYSVGPDIAARLVEVLSGMPFDEFLHKRILEPLGMNDTDYWVPPGKADRLATVYKSQDGQLVPVDRAHESNRAMLAITDAYSTKPKRTGGAYGLASTAVDYWRFAQMLADGGRFEGLRILSPETIGFMTRDHLNSIPVQTIRYGMPEGLGFGLGFAVVKNPALAGFVSSDGAFFWTGAAHTIFWVDPRKDLVVVAMLQTLGVPATEDFWAQIRALVYSAIIQ